MVFHTTCAIHLVEPIQSPRRSVEGKALVVIGYWHTVVAAVGMVTCDCSVKVKISGVD